jgi:Type VI secretion system (T6SS), amidase effector protein 4
MATPALSNLWTAFPDHIAYPTLEDLYTMLGGKAAANIDSPGFGKNGNTCASRMSVALNRGGSPIAGGSGVETVGAADGSRIIFRVTHLRRYLLAKFGKPTLDITTPYDDAFSGKKGIVAFTVEGWSDASGHIALFNGTAYREPTHDNYSAFVRGTARTVRGEFWEMR